jgi:serine phosphatase RsbU (regulator of sigma subunit)
MLRLNFFIFNFLFISLLKVGAQTSWTKKSADSFLYVLQSSPNKHLLGYEIDIYFHNRNKQKELFDYLLAKTNKIDDTEALFVHTLIMEQTARQYYIRNKKDTATARLYYEKAEKILKNAGHPCKAIEVWKSFADELTQIKLDSSLAHKILKRIYANAEKTKCFDALVQVEHSIGIFLGERYGNYRKSLEHLLKAVDLIEKYDAKPEVKIDIYQALGSLFYKAGNYEKALEYWLNMYDIHLTLKKDEKRFLRLSEARLLNDIGLAYKNKEEYEKALFYYEKAIEAAKQVKDTFWMNLPKGNIGDILLKRNALDTAFVLFDIYLKNAQKYQDWGIVVAGHNKIANYYYLKKNYTEAEKFLEKSQQILSDKKQVIASYNAILPVVSQKIIWETLSKIKTAKGEYKSALEYQNKYVNLNDSINKIVGAQQLQLLAIDYQIRQENLKKQLLKEEIKQKEYFVMISSFVTLVSLILGVMLLNNRQKVQKQRNILQNKNKEIAAINEEISLKNKDIMDSIYYAERIQKAFLPYETRTQKILNDYFVIYQPRNIVSGDFYYILEQEGLIFIVVGDCTGHGVPGALMSMLGVTLLDQIIIEKRIHRPADIIDNLNRGVIKALHQEQTSSQDGMDISVCIWNKTTKILQIAGAKNSVILLHYDQFDEIRTDRYTVGGVGFGQEEKNFTEHERLIASDTMLYLFTDGYADQFNDKDHKKIGKRRFFDLLKKYHKEPSLQQKYQLQIFLREWQGKQEQIDDITILGVRLS